MLTEKANTICLLEILQEYSDAEHILSMQEIQTKMGQIYGLNPDRRTIYSALGLLLELGYDISMYDENKKGYYLRSRQIEPAEIALLTGAVHAFPFIPAKQSEQLIAKLQKQISVHQRKQYRHLTVVREEKKTDNKQVFWNIEQLDEAIAQKKKVAFKYLEYHVDKKLHPRREEQYIVNPYEMVYTNEHYYLICTLDGYENTSLYRIDRMVDIEILDDTRESKANYKSETEDTVYAFSGQPERISIKCDICILNDVIDKFGTEIIIKPLDNQYFMTTFTASPRGIKYWALQYLPYAEVVEPKWLREEIKESLEKTLY